MTYKNVYCTEVEELLNSKPNKIIRIMPFLLLILLIIGVAFVKSQNNFNGDLIEVSVYFEELNTNSYHFDKSDIFAFGDLFIKSNDSLLIHELKLISEVSKEQDEKINIGNKLIINLQDSPIQIESEVIGKRIEGSKFLIDIGVQQGQKKELYSYLLKNISGKINAKFELK